MGIEEFLLYQAREKGFKEGLEIALIQRALEMDIAFTRNLLTLTDRSILKIAQLVGVSEDFVLKVKDELSK
jgi:hypothetical protein